MTEQEFFDAVEETINGKELLTAEQENKLSQKILAGAEAGRILNSRCSSIREEQRAELEQAVWEGERCFDILVLANLRLARKFANEAGRKNPGRVNETADYEQTAAVVLCECARTFDWKRKVRFSTYVYRRISQALIRENSRVAYQMRIPEELIYIVGKLNANLDTHGIRETARKMDLTEGQIAKLISATKKGPSLDEPIDSDEMEAELNEVIADASAQTGHDIEDLIQMEEDIKWLYKGLQNLKKWERDLICMRFGLCGKEPHKLNELTGTTAQTVAGVQKQITSILRKMKADYDRSLPWAE